MRYLFSSPDSARIGLVQSLLDSQGIEFELRNEAVSQSEVGMPFMTELWVLHDEDHENALSLIQANSTDS